MMMYEFSKFWRFSAVAGFLWLPTVLAAAPVGVVIKDGGDTPRTLENCGDLKELITDPGNVTLWVTGTCNVAGGGGGGGETPVAVPINYGDVNENTTVTIDVNNYPIVVTNPSSVTVTAVTTPSIGGTVSKAGSKVTWSVPEVTTDTPNVTINYTIDDASSGAPSSSSISFNVLDGTPPPPPPTGSCVETGNIVCKGSPDWPAGTNFGPNHATSTDFEIWEFTYTAGKGAGSFVFVNAAGGNPIYGRTAIISEVPDESMSDYVAGNAYCQRTNWGSETKLFFNKAGSNAYYECPLVEGTKYFLKMQINDPNVSDSYYLTTY